MLVSNKPITRHDLDRLSELESTIQDAFWTVGEALEQIRSERLYKVRGFETFKSYMQARWGKSDSWARLAILTSAIALNVQRQAPELTLKNRAHARALMDVPADYQPVIVQTAYKQAEAEGRTPTAGDIESVKSVVMDMVHTGCVDTGDGNMTPVGAALSLEAHERQQRQKQHITDSMERRGKRIEIVGRVSEIGTLSIELPRTYAGQQVKVWVSIQETTHDDSQP